MSGNDDNVVRTRDYYDNKDTDIFYRKAWGDEHIHLGIFKDYYEPIQSACLRTVRTMAEKVGSISSDTEVLDIGSGYGGTARYLASTYGCHVNALNLSEVQNRRSEELNRKRKLQRNISIVEGSFEDMPFEDETMDICWSIDAILHSGNRKKVVEEVSRVLRPGGDFVFTDPMRTDDCPHDILEPILERIHLSDMGSLSFYRSEARDAGLEEVSFTDLSQHLVNTYGRVLEFTENNEETLSDEISREFIDHMEEGLRHWVEGGKEGHLGWGIMHFRKKT